MLSRMGQQIRNNGVPMLDKSLLRSKKKQFVINFRDTDTLPQRLVATAATLNITPEQLIKRFVLDGMCSSEPAPVASGESLTAFFLKSGLTR